MKREKKKRKKNRNTIFNHQKDETPIYRYGRHGIFCATRLEEILQRRCVDAIWRIGEVQVPVEEIKNKNKNLQQ